MAGLTGGGVHEVDALATQLAPMLGAADAKSCEVAIFRADLAADRQKLAGLIRESRVLACHDTLDLQLRELFETRLPQRDLNPATLDTLIREHLRGVPPSHYGVWVYYPWSRLAVHLLPEAEFLELRTSRNCNKITKDEQEKLRRRRIGVIGLSVGQASAVTMAMEEVGGEFYLADFDRLSLSNMNRLRAGVHDLDTNKVVLTARAILEFNPFARLKLFPDGITPENLDAFLNDGRPLDVLVEECDDFYLKVLARQRARALRIPVVMETSDRGLIDIERFDREPNRPFFHGVVGDLDPERFRAVKMIDKMPLGIEIIGGAGVSPRLAASGLEIGETLKTWPQLASAVALGGAITTDAVRRMGLGELMESGRYYVDSERIICDGRSEQVRPDETLRKRFSAEALAPLRLPEIKRSRGAAITKEQARDLVSYGIMAPSGGNAQPWRFRFDGKALHCILVPERSTAMLDYAHLASYMGVGAAAENIVLAARQLGVRPRVQLFPQGTEPNLVCTIHLDEGGQAEPTQEETELFQNIVSRLTNRKVGKRLAFAPEAAELLRAQAAVHGARLQLVSDDAQLAAVANLIGPGDRMRFVSKRMHGELVSEIRWSPEEVERTRDGLDAETLELSAVDRAGLRVASSLGVMDLLGKVGGGKSLERSGRACINGASAVGLLTVGGGHTPGAMFVGGRALERVWLKATALGFSFQPMTGLVCLFWRLLDGAPELSPKEVTQLEQLRKDYLNLFPLPEKTAEIMLFRLAKSDPPSAHSLRLHVKDVFDFAPPSKV